MDGPGRKAPTQPPGEMLDEAALEVFMSSLGFDAVLLDCFEQGIRDAVAADEAILKRSGKAT